MQPEKQEKKVALLISYMPMVDLQRIEKHKGQFSNYSEEWLNEISSMISENDIDTMGVAWSLETENETNKTHAINATIILKEKAQELHDHMNQWADGQISERFGWHIISTDDKSYTFQILADPAKSIERWKIANNLYGDSTADEIINYKVLCLPVQSHQVDATSLNLVTETYNRENNTNLNLRTDETTLRVNFINVDKILDDNGELSRDKFTTEIRNIPWLTLNRIKGHEHLASPE
jgi:hypothetical protein